MSNSAKKKDLFLSYSSRDAEIVERLARDLRNHQITVWLDKWEILVGDNVTEKIQAGIQEARYVGIWLTNESVHSRWVSKEWFSAIFQEVSKQNVQILPLLGERCEIPLFLADKSYADFSESYQGGLNELLKTLKRKRKITKSIDRSKEGHSVSYHTQQFLRELEGEMILIPNHGNLKIIKSLKTLPRSGKKIRLEKFEPTLPIRSIYDHILSVAHTADVLLPHLRHSATGRERFEIARLIAYHDICEVILGDVPQFTRLNDTKRRRARVVAQARLAQLPENEPEKTTYQFIALFLQETERQNLLWVADNLFKKSFFHQGLPSF